MHPEYQVKINLLPRKPEQWHPPETCRPDMSNQLPLDARGVCWSDQVLPALDLRGSKLCRADLRGADLSCCQLEGCDLRLARYDMDSKFPEGFNPLKSGAIGPRAYLNGAFFNGADLRGMDLGESSFVGAYLSGCDLSGTMLDAASLVGADLRFARLQGASCKETRFTGSQLDQADLRAADLTNTSIENAESIKGADFSWATGLTSEQLTILLSRPHSELDCWNPLTRTTTRASLESLQC
jgi:uncharacterized protein YjbI with pentapeptide repeats